MPAFDTLAYAKEVEEAGFTRRQAEAFASAQKKLLQDVMSTGEVVTKTDLDSVQTTLREEIQSVRAAMQTMRAELKEEMQGVRLELKTELADTKHEILKWMVTAMVAQSALLIAVLAFT